MSQFVSLSDDPVIMRLQITLLTQELDNFKEEKNVIKNQNFKLCKIVKKLVRENEKLVKRLNSLEPKPVDSGYVTEDPS